MMTPQTPQLYHSVSTESQFLLSSTDGARRRGADTAPAPGPQPAGVLDRDQLLNAFPALQTGSRLLSQSLKRLDALALFGILVVRRDPAPPEEQTDPADLAIARAVDALCAEKDGWWGIIEPDLFVCFFPDSNDLACHQIAGQLRERIGALTAPTVSMGIAAFPTGGFARDEILANAYKALDHAAFFGPDSRTVFDDVSLNISGDHLFQRGDITGAMAEFSAALNMAPANVNVCNSLGVCHSLLGQFDPAIDAFGAALRLAPEEFMAHYNLGLVHLLMAQHQEALTHFLTASRLAGDVYEVALQTGRAYLELAEPEKALAHIQTAIGLKPTAHAYRLCGDAFAALARTQEAIDAYRQAVKQNPNDAAALSSLGLLYAGRSENPEIARLFCEKSVEISPEEGLYRHQLGQLYLMQNQLEEALEAFQQAQDRGYDASADIERIEALRHPSEDPAC